MTDDAPAPEAVAVDKVVDETAAVQSASGSNSVTIRTGIKEKDEIEISFVVTGTELGSLPKAALLLVFLRTVPLFSTTADAGPLATPPAAWRPDLLVVESVGGGGGVVDAGKLLVWLMVGSFSVTLTEFFFELRMATLYMSTPNNKS